MLCFVFALLVVLLDQFIKRWAVLTIALKERVEFIPGFVGFTYEQNKGAAFSILSDHRWLLILIAVIAVLLLIAILLRYREGFWGTLGLAAVLGGTIGNLVDRLLLGYVVDIFEFRFMTFAIFNVADIFITVGGITFLLAFIFSSFKTDPADKKLSGNESDEPVPDIYSVTEDQIGLYDFQYGEEDSDPVSEILNSISNTTVSGSVRQNEPGYTADQYSGTVTPSEDMLASLGVLSGLEQELQALGNIDDYDLDELLREYGFEDDTTLL